MAHFAKVADGKVVQVIVAESEFFSSFVDASPGQWIQTSYNTSGGVHFNPDTGEPSDDQSKALRKNYAGIGFTYDEGRDAFIPPQLYASWVLNEQSCLWESPVPHPTDGGMYQWNEASQTWDEVPDEPQ